MGGLYVLAGLNHFIHPDFYLKMLNGFLPFPNALNNIGGLAEVILGIGVCIPGYRKMAAWGVILLLVAVFPANVNMAIHWQDWGTSATPFLIRLPIQILLIWWAYVYTKAESNLG